MDEKPTQPGAKLVTVEDAARVLSMSRSKIWELVGEGRIPSLKIGGSRRIKLADLDHFVDRLAAEAPGQLPPR